MSIKHYARPARRHEQAHQMWMIITAWVSLKSSGHLERPGIITYGELAELMGYPVEAGVMMGEALGAVARLCKSEGLPLLNVVVVNAETGLPGQLVVKDKRPMEVQQTEVQEYDWFSIRQPSMKSFLKAWNDM